MNRMLRALTALPLAALALSACATMSGATDAEVGGRAGDRASPGEAPVGPAAQGSPADSRVTAPTAAGATPPVAGAPPVPPPGAQGSAAAADVYLRRIALLDDSGPQLNAVMALKNRATLAREVAQAAGLPLGGRTVLVKDNIETSEWPTTAGSLALEGNSTGRDAPLIARLRQAGGVVLGKTNLSEWANIRSTRSTSGWSATGGQTRNPHAVDRNTCGSSSGSGAAVAAGLAWAAIGTETDGSITCPASVNGVVGFKPTVGLVSRTHVVPISHSQDTAGPMTRSVADAALLLGAIAGTDPADPATSEADARIADYTAGLRSASLAGLRIGVLRKQVGNDPKVAALFDQALADLRRAGAELVEIEYEAPDDLGEQEYTTLLYELREDLAAYLASSPAADEEMRWFDQDIFEQAEATTDRAAYQSARANALRLAGEEGIDGLLAEHDVRFLVAPTTGPAWATDLVHGDHYNGSIGAGNLAAVAGTPHLSVPMGAVEGLPVGLSILGAKWEDEAVLRAGAAYERARSAAVPEPAFKPWQGLAGQ